MLGVPNLSPAELSRVRDERGRELFKAVASQSGVAIEQPPSSMAWPVPEHAYSRVPGKSRSKFDQTQRLQSERSMQWPPKSRQTCLVNPNSFGFLVPKPCKTAKFFNPLNVFPMSPVFVTTPFLVQKALKTANSEKCVFSCPASTVQPGPPNSLVFRRKPVPGVRHAPKSVFCLEKPANSSPLSLSPPKSPVSNTSARRGTAQSQSASDAAARRGAPE